jgi:hypothetical protein
MKTFEVNGIRYPLSELKKWIDALRSGQYQQDTCRLQSDKGFCCLGVACKALIRKNNLDFDTYIDEKGRHHAVIMGAMPIQQPSAPKWLTQIEGDFSDKTGVNLTRLNDQWNLRDKTFEYVADLLETVYIHEIYDTIQASYWGNDPEGDLIVIRANLGVKP